MNESGKKTERLKEQIESARSDIQWKKAELYLGLGRSDSSQISEVEWSEFLSQSITKRFPEGLTVIDASGQVERITGQLVKQASNLVIIIHEDSPENRNALKEIIAEYKKKFQTDYAMQVISPVRIAF